MKENEFAVITKGIAFNTYSFLLKPTYGIEIKVLL